MPLVGLLSLTVILVTLVAHRDLPGKFPGALAAVLLGVVAYQLCAGHRDRPPAWRWCRRRRQRAARPGDSPLPCRFVRGAPGWWEPVFAAALAKLPVMLPFALATIVGGIDCTESAAAAGDEYRHAARSC